MEIKPSGLLGEYLVAGASSQHQPLPRRQQAVFVHRDRVGTGPYHVPFYESSQFTDDELAQPAANFLDEAVPIGETMCLGHGEYAAFEPGLLPKPLAIAPGAYLCVIAMRGERIVRWAYGSKAEVVATLAAHARLRLRGAWRLAQRGRLDAANTAGWEALHADPTRWEPPLLLCHLARRTPEDDLREAIQGALVVRAGKTLAEHDDPSVPAAIKQTLIAAANDMVAEEAMLAPKRIDMLIDGLLPIVRARVRPAGRCASGSGP